MSFITTDKILKLQAIIKSETSFIQVIIVPRQVGKSSTIQKIQESLSKSHKIFHVSADGEVLRSAS